MDVRLLGLAALLVTLAAMPAAAEETLDDPLDCLARSMYFEARDSGANGMAAVGWVVLNRAAHPGFPDTVCAVVTEGGETPPCQFSWWCDGKSDRPRNLSSWRLARQLAAELILDPPPDPTGQAIFFHDVVIDPDWNTLERTAEIGTHIFYRGHF
jgi:N-acetylmuramoyl-L-alanine amidase